MTPSNLAIVFGPNLMRPKVETIESNLNIPKLNIIVGDMIGHVKEVF